MADTGIHLKSLTMMMLHYTIALRSAVKRSIKKKTGDAGSASQVRNSLRLLNKSFYNEFIIQLQLK